MCARFLLFAAISLLVTASVLETYAARPRRGRTNCADLGGACTHFLTPCGDNKTIFVGGCSSRSSKCCVVKPSNSEIEDGVYRLVNGNAVYQQRKHSATHAGGVQRNTCTGVGGTCIHWQTPCGDNETNVVGGCSSRSSKCCKAKPLDSEFEDGVYRFVNGNLVYQQRKHSAAERVHTGLVQRNRCTQVGGTCIHWKMECGDNETNVVGGCSSRSSQCCKAKPLDSEFEDGVYRFVNGNLVYQQRQNGISKTYRAGVGN